MGYIIEHCFNVSVANYERDAGSGDGGPSTTERQRLKEPEREHQQHPDRRSHRGQREQDFHASGPNQKWSADSADAGTTDQRCVAAGVVPA